MYSEMKIASQIMNIRILIEFDQLEGKQKQQGKSQLSYYNSKPENKNN